ncbi:caspase family protein [Bacillota bacterium LX-D]|nr:caspase family protein [Bacillota bacterium LX-D]
MVWQRRIEKIFLLGVFLFLFLLTPSYANAQGTYRALLIGNYQYIDGNDLNGPPADLDRMDNILAKSRFGTAKEHFSAIKRVDNATKAQMLSAIKAAFKDADDDDVSYFYYSGHGALDNYGQAYLWAVDSYYYEDSLNVDELESALSSIPGTKVVILDSCFSGGFINKDTSQTDPVLQEQQAAFNEAVKKAFGKEQLKGFLTSSQFKVLTAASKDETSVDTAYAPDWGFGGEFTNALVKGCGYITNYYPADRNNDGEISLFEIYYYTKNKVINSNVQVYPENDSFEFIGLENYIPVTAISLNQSQLNLKEGEGYQLVANLSPQDASVKNVKWSSSDTNIAIVDSTGYVLAKQRGNCKIVATTENESLSAVCQVEVESKELSEYTEFQGPTVFNDIDLTKAWSIKFNKTLNPYTVNSNNINIVDNNLLQHPSKVALNDDQRTVVVIPTRDYLPNSHYSILINKGLLAEDKSQLKNGVIVNFWTKSNTALLHSPENLIATAVSTDAVELKWDQVEDADFYYVYYSDSPTGPFKAFTDESGAEQRFYWYDDYCVLVYGYDNNETVYYRVAAVKDGLTSDLSNVASATTFAEDYFTPLDTIWFGYFADYPEVEVGVALDSFFAEPNWEEQGNLVTFTGYCYYDGEEVRISLYFEVQGDDFSLTAGKRDDKILSDDEITYLLDVVYSDFQGLRNQQQGLWQKGSNKTGVHVYQRYQRDGSSG